MITTGSISRERASGEFPFLASKFKGRRAAIKDFTPLAPEFVFWVGPDGSLHDAHDAHRQNPPPGFAHIIDDPPDYGGFLRGRLASQNSRQLLVVYCRPEALSGDWPAVRQLLAGLEMLPVPVSEDTLVISDNGDVYGTLADLRSRVVG